MPFLKGMLEYAMRQYTFFSAVKIIYQEEK